MNSNPWNFFVYANKKRWMSRTLVALLGLALAAGCGPEGSDLAANETDGTSESDQASTDDQANIEDVDEQVIQQKAAALTQGTCGVRSDGKLWCNNRGGAAIRSSATNSGSVVDHLRTTYSWFSCWGTGSKHAGGNTTWYYTWGDDHNASGWVAAVDVSTSSAFDANPSANGLPKCNESSTKKVLPFTWQGQQTYYYCGPASTRIALSSLSSSVPNQSTLASYLGTTENGTNDISLVRNALNYYLRTNWFAAKYISDPATSAQRDLLKKDIVYNIDRGYPLVANVVSGWRPSGYPGGTIYHYVAIVGYDQGGNRVLIADPAGNCAAGQSWCNVPQTYWISTWNLGTWIAGKGYAA